MKKLWTLLCVVLCIFGMTACGGSSEKEEGVTAEQSDDLQKSMESLIASLVTMSDEEIQSQMSEEAAKAWLDVAPELGEYVGTIDFSLSVEDEVYTGILESDFTEHDLTMTVVIDGTTGLADSITYTQDMSIDEILDEVDSITYARDMSIGEILSKAALNTIIGMGVVFAVLTFIAFLISLFKFIPDFSKKEEKPAASAPVVAPVEETVEEEDLSDDLELVAVITAAIAASEGTSTEGFVVRSIKRAPSAKWKRA